MKNLKLTLHCGGHAVESTEVQKTPTPMPTESWMPIPHFTLVERLREIVGNAGLSITQEMNIGTVIGLRNSHDKSFPAGINAGSAPFVCDNLAFHNEVKIARRHTKFILRDLPNILAGAFGKLLNTWGNNAKRIEAYQAYTLKDNEAHDILARAYRCGAVSKTALADVLDQWEKPLHEEFAPRNLWSLHNAFTQVYKGNLIALPKRSQALHGILDPFAGLNLTVDLKPDLVTA